MTPIELTPEQRQQRQDDRAARIAKAIDSLPPAAQWLVQQWRAEVEASGRAAHGNGLCALEAFVSAVQAVCAPPQGRVKGLSLGREWSMRPPQRYRSATPVDLTADIFTTGGVAAILRIAPRTASQLVDSGRLKGWRIPGSLQRRVHRKDLLAFLRNNNMHDFLAEMESASSILLAGLPTPLEQRVTELLLPHMPIRTAASLFDVGLALSSPPSVAVVDLSIGGREEVRHAVGRLSEECRRVILLLPEDSPSVLRVAYDDNGCDLLTHPVDAALVAALVREGSE